MQIAKKAIGTTGDTSAYGKRMRRMQMGRRSREWEL